MSLNLAVHRSRDGSRRISERAGSPSNGLAIGLSGVCGVHAFATDRSDGEAGRPLFVRARCTELVKVDGGIGKHLDRYDHTIQSKLLRAYNLTHIRT